jgi:hypothetical protein
MAANRAAIPQTTLRQRRRARALLAISWDLTRMIQRPRSRACQITRLKYGRTALAYKVEHAVDMKMDANVAVTAHGCRESIASPLAGSGPPTGARGRVLGRYTQRKAVGRKMAGSERAASLCSYGEVTNLPGSRRVERIDGLSVIPKCAKPRLVNCRLHITRPVHGTARSIVTGSGGWTEMARCCS